MPKNQITGKGFDSSVIKDASEDDGDLVIEFKSGNSYRYVGAGNHLSALESAPSAGSYFNANIKGDFTAVAL